MPTGDRDTNRRKPELTRRISVRPSVFWNVLLHGLRSKYEVAVGKNQPEMSEVIQPVPHLDIEGLRCFQGALKLSRCYLEYGSGGSTVYAALVAGVPAIVSVESDKSWIDKVRNTLGSTNTHVYLEYCNLGEVGEWGSPKNDEKMRDFWKYAAAPWAVARKLNLVPDTVLIDGRFRVASFLTSLLRARIGTRIMFDDYLDRPRYFVVERFCSIEMMHGRMAVFTAARDFNVPDICDAICEFSVLPDS